MTLCYKHFTATCNFDVTGSIDSRHRPSLATVMVLIEIAARNYVLYVCLTALYFVRRVTHGRRAFTRASVTHILQIAKRRM